MFEILPESTDNCIGFKVTGSVTGEDYEKLLPYLDKAIGAHGKINMLVMLDDFDGWGDLDAAKADFKLGTTQYRLIQKAAFISERKWLKWAVKVMDPFTRHTEERFFEPAQLEEAWEWVKEG
jgi:hypothetical protein